jgi:hypothetical protein
VAMNLVADTNVWYDIGAGSRDPAALKSSGNRLIATPTSFLEIASRIDERTFPERKAAAQAVVSHADEIAEDCESHLAKLWGLPVSGPTIEWIEGFRAIAQASSPDELELGVADLDARVKRTVKLSVVAEWREYHWNDFRDRVVEALDQHIPGYLKARAKGRFKQLGEEDGKKLAMAMRSDEVRKFVVKSTFHRALLVVDQEPREPTSTEYGHADELVSPYVDAYTEYIIGCATEFAPQPNDLGDSECFLYLQDERSFLSSDARWVKIARRACPSLVYDPERKIPE